MWMSGQHQFRPSMATTQVSWIKLRVIGAHLLSPILLSRRLAHVLLPLQISSLDATSTEPTLVAIVSQELKKKDTLISCIQVALVTAIKGKLAVKMLHRHGLSASPPSMERKFVGCQVVIPLSTSQDLASIPFRALMDTVHALRLPTRIRQYVLWPGLRINRVQLQTFKLS